MFYKLRRKKSFTLVEILLALAILGVGLVSILSLFAVSVRSAGRTLALTRAGLIAQLTMEDLKAHALRSKPNYDGLTSSSSGVPGSLGQSTMPSCYSGLGFNRALQVTPNPQSTGLTDVTELQLTIGWDYNTSTSTYRRTETFVTNVARYTP